MGGMTKRFGAGKAHTGSKIKNLRETKIYQAYWQLPVALIIVVVLFFLIKMFLHWLVGSYLLWYWLNIWSLLISISILSGATAAIEDDNKVSSTAIAWFLITLFALVMIRDYSRIDHTKKATKISMAVHRLPLGESIFVLQPGESTPWLGFPKGIVSNYKISSSDNDYVLSFADGTQYGANISIPRKEHAYLRVVALQTAQRVTIMVTTPVVSASK